MVIEVSGFQVHENVPPNSKIEWKIIKIWVTPTPPLKYAFDHLDEMNPKYKS